VGRPRDLSRATCCEALGPGRCRVNQRQEQGVRTVDMKLEVVTLPVSDVDRAKSFYESLDWRMDIDLVVSDELRTFTTRLPGREWED
jgi:hypothetical protein